MKGLVFTLDALFALSITVLVITFIYVFVSNQYSVLYNPGADLYKIADSVSNVLEKDGTLANCSAVAERGDIENAKNTGHFNCYLKDTLEDLIPDANSQIILYQFNGTTLNNITPPVTNPGNAEKGGDIVVVRRALTNIILFNDEISNLTINSTSSLELINQINVTFYNPSGQDLTDVKIKIYDSFGKKQGAKQGWVVSPGKLSGTMEEFNFIVDVPQSAETDVYLAEAEEKDLGVIASRHFNVFKPGMVELYVWK